jgi:hypothetical protein
MDEIKSPGIVWGFLFVDAPRMSPLGHSLPIHSARVPNNVRCRSNSGQTRVRPNCPLSANSVRFAATPEQSKSARSGLPGIFYFQG